MGIIKRQSIKNSIVNYAGLGIGAISTLFIYSLDTETYGLVQFLLKLGTLLLPLATLGTISLTIRFFPEFKSRYGGPESFLWLLLLILCCSLSVFYLIAHFFEADIYALLARINFKIELYETYGKYGFLLCILLSLILFFDYYIRNYNRIVVQAVLTNLWPKVALPLFFLLFYFGFLNIIQFVQSVLFYHLLALLGLIIYLYYLRGLRIRRPREPLDRGLLREMAVYAFYGILGAVGNSLALQIDAVMVPSLINTQANGIYMIAAFIAGAIEIPYKAVNNIAAPVIANAWKNNDLGEIASLYRKSSNTLVAAGLLLFVLVWISLDDLFLLTPKAGELKTAKYVVFYLGLARVVDMFTSVNGSIIYYSRHFRFMLFALLLMGALNVWLNFLLIPIFSFTGSAIATLIAMICFNLVKLIFIQVKFKMHPFTRESLGLILVAGLTYLLGVFLPATSFPLLNIAFRSSVCILFFVLIVFRFNLSPDLQSLTLEAFKRLRERWGPRQ